MNDIIKNFFVGILKNRWLIYAGLCIIGAIINWSQGKTAGFESTQMMLAFILHRLENK